jgi:alpha-tubulin suppressor-like RCC1 family protein
LTLQGPETEVDGCTIFGNQLYSYDGAGGTPIHTGGSGSIKNTIVWGNTPAANGNGVYAASVSYCLFDTVARHHTTNIAFSGVLNTDPLFSNSNGGDFRLAVGSAAMNAGDPDSPYDLDGSQADIGYRLIFQTRNFFSWGTNSPEGRLSVPADLLNVKSIDAGFNHSVALKSDGTLVVWGGNGGSENIATVPTGLANIAEIDCGWAWTLVRRENGSLFAWGADDSGQISSLPSESNFVQISAGNMHGAALRLDGTVVCWGRNDMGQCNVPSDLSGVTAVIAYGHHTMALCSDGSVSVWGASSPVPSGLGGVTSIAAGDAFCLALKSDGTVVAWGENTYGQSTVPSGLNNVSKIFATADAAFAVKDDGAIVSWGNNQSGQRNIPALVNGCRIIDICGNAHHAFVTIANDIDSDGDGVSDYREQKDGTDPSNANSFDPLSKGLVAYYPFNGNLIDDSGRANDLQSGVGISYDSDRKILVNSSLRFAGANSFATTRFPIGISGNQPRSVSFWVKLDGATYYNNSIVSFGDGSQDTKPNSLFFSTANGDCFQMWGSWIDKGTLPLAFNRQSWNQVTFVHATSVSGDKFYLNGVEVPSTFGDYGRGDIWNTTNTPLTIGKFGDFFQSESLALDDLRIYDRALSESEVAQLYLQESGNTFDADGDGVNDYREQKDSTDPNNASSFDPLSKGLVIYYPFQGNLRDESGFGNDIVLAGGNLTIGSSDAENSALQVGIEDGAKSENNVGITGNSNFTVSFWMKPTQHPEFPEACVIGWGAIPTQDGTVTHFYYRPYQNGANLDIDEGNVGARVQSHTANLTGIWSHITYTYHSANRSLAIYRNGELQTTNYQTYNMELHNLGDSKLYLGGTTKTGDHPPDEYGGRGLPGILDDVRVYNRTLTGAEVRELYVVEALDETAPQISLLGENPMVVFKGALFTDPGATVTDNADATWTVAGNGTVDTSMVGNNTLTYTASDLSGNIASSVERSVVVVLDPNGDEDSDGLKNSVETDTGVFVSATDTGTDPLVADTNSDGFRDGEAVGAGLNPLTNYAGAIALVKQLSAVTPGRFDLYTTDAMMDLNLGALTIQKNGQTVTVELQLQSTTNLATQPFTNLGAPVEFQMEMPSNKGFLRVHARGSQ